MSGQITQYVLKVHSRCDLACDHCYVYEHADQSWRVKPLAMSAATAEAAAQRIAEHATLHQLTQVQVVLHGGEPLLLGRDRMRSILATLEAGIASAADVDLRLHTNGMLLDSEWCALFRDYGLRIGISLDGDRAANDRHRRYSDGRSSYDQVRGALALLRTSDYRELYAGILCTIDLSNDPIAVYESLIAEQPPNLDLLLPHATWEHPPANPAGLAAPYADWMMRVYRRWTHDGRPVPIRFFDSLISAARGERSRSEVVGVDPVDLLVIDTDGSWEHPDSLKTAFDGAPSTGLNVFDHSIDEVAAQAGFRTRLGGVPALCSTCRECSVVRICGGGMYAHRYSTRTSFDNPSVYCADMKTLIGEIAPNNARPAVNVPPEATHKLPAGAFETLAAGPGSVVGVEALAAMRLSVTRALVAAVARADDRWQDKDLQVASTEGWALLCDLDRNNRSAVSFVLAHPYAYAWALRCLRPGPDCDRDLDRAHLAGLAAAAALRAGVRTRLPLPVRDGKLQIPAMGALDVRAGGTRTITVSLLAGRPTADGYPALWLPTRRVADGRLDIAVEDLDPFRDCQAWPAADRLSAPSWRGWHSALTVASAKLTNALPAYAEVIGAGLRAVAPLRNASGTDRSATARQAFGAVGLAFPRAPGSLDALLLHEFQHTKLHALTELRELFDVDNRRTLRVPWRDQPRPIEGALHGAYAYLALCHLWRSRQPMTSRHRTYRDWVRAVTDSLIESGALTSEGEHFVAGMHSATANSRDE